MPLLSHPQLVLVCSQLCQKYSWLLDCYVVDFFTEDHWSKLPKCWQTALQNLTFSEIAEFLDPEREMSGRVWPLSLLALKEFLYHLTLSREREEYEVDLSYNTIYENLTEAFWKNVKAKKRHEISVMAKICYDTGLTRSTFFIVDVGAGLGHLGRILDFGFGFSVCSIDMQKSLLDQGDRLDVEFQKHLRRVFRYRYGRGRTVRVHKKIESNITTAEFLELVLNAYGIRDSEFAFGIVGLHPCGDLGPTLLRIYNECEQVRFINLVGCCYHKLTTPPAPNPGFPLSENAIENQINLSYQQRELACHAIESYVEKLETQESSRLKIHAYRAVLETILCAKSPDYRRCALNNVKYDEDLTFEEYCKKATQKLNIDFSGDDLNSPEIEAMLSRWKDVVTFYSLRLMFAPLIEGIILLDRFIFAKKLGKKKLKKTELRQVFDPMISPRVHVLIGRKKFPYEDEILEQLVNLP